MPDTSPREHLEHDLPALVRFLSATVPALVVRPVLGAILTAAVTLGVRTVLEYTERVRGHPIVPFAPAHRPTRAELAAYVERRPELAHLADELAEARAAGGDVRRRLWGELRRRIGAAQADLAAPLAGSRGAVERLDSLLGRLARLGTVELPDAETRRLLAFVEERLADDEG